MIKMEQSPKNIVWNLTVVLKDWSEGLICGVRSHAHNRSKRIICNTPWVYYTKMTFDRESIEAQELSSDLS